MSGHTVPFHEPPSSRDESAHSTSGEDLSRLTSAAAVQGNEWRAATVVDSTHDRLRLLGQRVLGGGQITREEALWLFHLEGAADIFSLMSWANRVREHYKGNKIHL